MGKINITRGGTKKINISSKKANEENLQASYEKREQEIAEKRREKEREISKKFYENSIKALNNATIDVDLDIKEQEELKKKKNKKLLINWSIVSVAAITIISMFFFGIKNAFFTQNYTGEEVAALANKYNGKTNFPEGGVYGYIKQNAQGLMKDNLNLYNNIANADVGVRVKNPTVVAISARSDKEAAVIFQAELETTAGTQEMNFSTTVTWDGNKYGTLGQVSVYPREVPDKPSKPGKDSYEFPDDAHPDSANMEESKVFVDHFFDIYYKGQDVSPFYNGTAKLETPAKIEYKGIDNYVLMDNPNQFGYNARANLTLRLPNGVEYKTVKYISIKKEGKAWQIDKLY